MAIRGALGFRDFCVRIAESSGLPLSVQSMLLDFGTGWGRIARAFMRDVPASRIFAVEPFDFILEARRSNPYINFVKSNPLPPLPFSSGTFSHLVTWSTFTHFNQKYFDAWINEFARVTRKGGLCFISILGKSFLRGLEVDIKRKEEGLDVHFWKDLIIKRIKSGDVKEILSSALDGDFVWLPSVQVARQEFAECFVTGAYFERNFAGSFDVVYETSENELAQDCIVLRRK